MKNIELIMIAQDAAGIDISESCNTFARWKEMGYTVNKGEKAAFECYIWKMPKGKQETETENKKKKVKMIMKKAFFFRPCQVTKIEK